MKNNLLIATFISTALMGCTNNDSPQMDESLKVECYSRSSENSRELVKDFGMYVFSSSGNSYPGVSNPVHVTYSDGWNFSPVLLKETAQIYTFSPYIETTDCTSLNISLSNQTDYLASNSSITANKDNPSVSITMEHILSKINVTIDGSSSCQVKLLDIPISATYNLKTNILTAGSRADLTTNSSSVLICPSASQILKMSITYNGKEYEYTEATKKYEPGKEYTFKLTINDSKELIISGDITITDWLPAGDYDGTVNEK